MTVNWLPKSKKLNHKQRARLIDGILQKKDANPPVPFISGQKCLELRLMIETGNEEGAWNEYLHLAQVAEGQARDLAIKKSLHKFGEALPLALRQQNLSSAKLQTNNVNSDDIEVVKVNSTYTPRNAIGKLAVKAASEIEHETKVRASAKQVMERFQKWIDEKTETNYLIKFDKKNRSVTWNTENACEVIYTVYACEKTLGKWNKGRQ